MGSVTLLVLAAFASSASADSATLRSSVRAATEEGAVRLRDLAALDGPEAERLGDVLMVTVPASSHVRELSIEEVRRRLDEAGANWAKLDLRGQRVVVRPRISEGNPTACMPASVEPGARRSGPASATGAGASGTGAAPSETVAATGSAPAARAPVGAAGRAGGLVPKASGVSQAQRASRGNTRNFRDAPAGAVLAADVISDGSARGLAADAVARALGETPESVRLSFESMDPEVISGAPQGTRVEIDPMGAMDTDHVEFNVRWWRDGRVERRGSLSVWPQVARQASVAARDMKKGDRPETADLASETRWVRPSERNRVAKPGSPAGRPLAGAVKAGQTLLDDHLDREILIRRGDRIVVRTLVGSLAVSVDAVAQTDGREGEAIECFRVGAKERKDRVPLLVTVTGKGEAVMRTAR